MAIIPYLSFNGNAKEVMAYYVEVFGLEPPEIMLFKEMPEDPNFPVPEALSEMVMHGSLRLGEDQLMFSDSLEEMNGKLIVGNNITIMYSIKDLDKLKSIFDQLARQGQVIMPFAQTFWSQGFGMVIDQFGIGWQLNFDE